MTSNPILKWLNVGSEATIAAAFFCLFVATLYYSRNKDRSLRRMLLVPAIFLVLSGITRVIIILSSWHPYFEVLILAKALSAVACVFSAIVVIPNLRRLARLAQLEANDLIRIQLEAEMTVRRQTEESLRLYEQIITNSSEGVLVISSKDDTILHVNPMFEKMYGYEAGELVGQCTRIFKESQTEYDSIRHDMAQALSVQGLWRGELQNRRKDGASIWCKAGFTRFQHPEHGEVWIATVADITQWKHAQEKIHDQQAKITASARMAALGEMAAGIGHEINNPLSVIKATAEDTCELLELGDLTKTEIIQRLQKIEHTSHRIARIIRGLRAFAREGENTPIRRVNVKDIVTDTLSLCGQRFTKHQVTVDIEEIPSDAFIDCRPEQISQVLLNLLNNSFDALEGVEDKWIKVQVRTTATETEVLVCDNGRGIAPELGEKIMQPFFSTKEPGKGSGLGLSISKGIVESHGGQLQFISGRPHTEFAFRLPKSATPLISEPPENFSLLQTSPAPLDHTA